MFNVLFIGLETINNDLSINWSLEKLNFYGIVVVLHIEYLVPLIYALVNLICVDLVYWEIVKLYDLSLVLIYG